MAYIPKDAKWYIAELVEQITVEGDDRSVVHKNLVLIRADSPEEAYESAVTLGRESEDSYSNPAGQQVHIRFRGIADLNVVYDELKNGTELLYEEHVGLENDEIERLTRPKDLLSIFRPVESRKTPDYSERAVMEGVKRIRNSSNQ